MTPQEHRDIPTRWLTLLGRMMSRLLGYAIVPCPARVTIKATRVAERHPALPPR